MLFLGAASCWLGGWGWLLPAPSGALLCIRLRPQQQEQQGVKATIRTNISMHGVQLQGCQMMSG